MTGNTADLSEVHGSEWHSDPRFSDEEKAEITQFIRERDKVLHDGSEHLVDAACLKEDRAGTKSAMRERHREADDAFFEFVTGLPRHRMMTDEEKDKRERLLNDMGPEERRHHRAEVLKRALELRSIRLEYANGVLTPEEKEHCLRYHEDKAYRHEGDSPMGRAHRLKDEVMKDFPIERVKPLVRDLPLMQIYMRLRKAFKQFILSPHFQPAYDEVAAALAEFPAAVAAAEAKAKAKAKPDQSP